MTSHRPRPGAGSRVSLMLVKAEGDGAGVGERYVDGIADEADDEQTAVVCARKMVLGTSCDLILPRPGVGTAVSSYK